MSLTNAQLTFYDHNVLRLPRDKRVEYNAQVDRLTSRLTNSLHTHTEYKVSRVIKAGSFAKHTILRRASGRSLDVDVAFYLAGRDVNHENYASLSEDVHDLLVKLYPSKNVEDFEIQRRAATVTFIGSGLDVDVVPIIADGERDGYGYQFGSDGSKVETCVPGQLAFLRTRKDRDANFRTLVRLAKQWRHHHAVPGLKGYSLELVMAALLDRDGATASIESRFRTFLRFIAQRGLREVITFPENRGGVSFTSPVKLADPVNGQNNVGARITETELQIIETRAGEAYETATYASVENDPTLWKEVFGPRFRVED